MPAALSYPGVYIEEIPSGVRTIVQVPTSVTAFVGRTKKGPLAEATDITSWSDFERQFGGLWNDSQLPFAVRDYYQNGGSRAVIVRLFEPVFESDDEKAAARQALTDLKTAVSAAGMDNGKKVKEAFNGKLGSPQVEASIKGKKKKAEEESTAAPADEAKKKELKKAQAAVDAAEAAATVIHRLADGAEDKDGKTPIADTINLMEATGLGLTKDKRELSIGISLNFEAFSPGKWAGYLRLVATPRGTDAFDLTITDISPGGASESFIGLTVADGPRRVDNVLRSESQLLRWRMDSSGNDLPLPAALPDFGVAKALGDAAVGTFYLTWLAIQKTETDPTDAAVVAAQNAYKKAIELALLSASDGKALDVDSFLPADPNKGPGLRALEQLFARDGIFNLLCIPPYLDGDKYVDVGVIAAAAAYCEERRAMLIVDPPKKWRDIDSANAGINAEIDEVGTTSKNAAIFFPRLKQENPFRGNQIEEFAPCGVVAGIFARTDTERGVWKAPAGIDATLKGVNSLKTRMTDLQNGRLNPLGINCLRHFPVYGQVVWGARTLQGADGIASEWKYIPVRRTALFIEESLFRGTKWVVFEPNDEPLWAQIRLAVGAFMNNLFRQGAFQGRSPREAYFVKCDGETTTQNHINLGIVNIRVGFAPLKPAEFVVIQLQQMAGQIAV